VICKYIYMQTYILYIYIYMCVYPCIIYTWISIQYVRKLMYDICLTRVSYIYFVIYSLCVKHLGSLYKLGQVHHDHICVHTNIWYIFTYIFFEYTHIYIYMYTVCICTETCKRILLYIKSLEHTGIYIYRRIEIAHKLFGLSGI